MDRDLRRYAAELKLPAGAVLEAAILSTSLPPLWSAHVDGTDGSVYFSREPAGGAGGAPPPTTWSHPGRDAFLVAYLEAAAAAETAAGERLRQQILRHLERSKGGPLPPSRLAPPNYPLTAAAALAELDVGEGDEDCVELLRRSRQLMRPLLSERTTLAAALKRQLALSGSNEARLTQQEGELARLAAEGAELELRLAALRADAREREREAKGALKIQSIQRGRKARAELGPAARKPTASPARKKAAADDRPPLKLVASAYISLFEGAEPEQLQPESSYVAPPLTLAPEIAMFELKPAPERQALAARSNQGATNAEQQYIASATST